jgi:hypothetical protein
MSISRTNSGFSVAMMRAGVIIAWIVLFAAPLVLFVGHLGAGGLNWLENGISTYAANAPNGNWVSAGILLAGLSIVCLGVGISLNTSLRISLLSQIASMCCGAAAAGLLMLCRYKETANNIEALKRMEFAAIRQQTFHDAGLLMFVSAAVLALMISGLIAMVRSASWGGRLLAAAVFVSGPIACAVVISSSQGPVGFLGTAPGLKQRAAFFCLWVGAFCLLTLLTKAAAQSVLRQREVDGEPFVR